MLPVLNGIWLSFHSAESFIAAPHWVGFANYIKLFGDAEFWRATLNGVVYALISVVLQLVLGVGFAIVLNKSFPRLLESFPKVLTFDFLCLSELKLAYLTLDFCIIQMKTN